MIKIITISFFLSISIHSFGQPWTEVYSGNNINDLFFANDNTGWLAGANGSIGKTTNGGINWLFQTLPGHGSDFITTLNFLDINTGWAVTNCCGGISSNAYLFKTTNAGVNWVQVNSQSIGVSTNSIAPLNKDTIFFSMGIANDGNNYGAIKKTTNGGINFSAFTDGVSIFNKCLFVNNTTGWCNTSSKLFKSTDTGNSWSLQTINGAAITNVYNVFFVDANTGYFAGRNGSPDFFFKTTNGGTNWQSIYFNGAVSFVNKISFVNANTGWVAGDNLTIAKTTNGGVDWTTFTLVNSFLYTARLQFVTPATGYTLITDGGTSYKLYKTTTGGIPTGFYQTLSENPDKFSVSQNYPNPFNPATTISWQLPLAGFVRLKIYNAAGLEVETLVNEKQNAGSYSVNFSAASLPSGIYFYKLDTENFSETKKMILIK